MGKIYCDTNKYEAFKHIALKIAVEDDGKSFYKLTIKVREQIVADGLPIDEYDVTMLVSTLMLNNGMMP